MTNEITFAGIELSSGRQPVTIAALDDRLNVHLLEKYDVVQAFECLEGYEHVSLAINVPSAKRLQGTYPTFKNKIVAAGFKSYGTKAAPKQWLETDAQDCFHKWTGKHLLPRRTLEGRVQRGLILYDQGLRITDPMDFFEEITRHHMLSGVFPNDLLYSTTELDALAAAYVAWLAVNEAGQVENMGNDLFLPREPERE